SNTDSINESEPSSEKEQGAKSSHVSRVVNEPIKAFPLGMVLKACPDVLDYGPGGAITSWRDLMSAAVVVRSMLGVSPSAYQAACETMGPENAAAAMACILERGGQINSAGGYLRDLTRRAEKGEFSLGPMLMALMRANGEGSQRTG
ncbi:plasmid replication protein RepC, partial [Pararhizobium antarcticum]|uniref:plasmid replication protein RepC n=1 Tax=Pararhizobium antarcticum TaxID=1798805 RepID=UPI000A798B11